MLSIQNQLASIAQYLDVVWYYNTYLGIWYMYDPNDIAGSNLPELLDYELYYIGVTAPCVINYSAGSKTYHFDLASVLPTYNTVTWNPSSANAPLASILASSEVPYNIVAGTFITITVTLLNSGAVAGVMSSGMYSEPADLGWESGDTAVVNPGSIGYVMVGFTMPNHNIVFDLLARHRDPITNAWVTDQVLGPFEALVTLGAPKASIWTHSIIPSVPVPAGTYIDMLIVVKNIGASSGLMQPWVTENDVDVYGMAPDPFWTEVAPNGTAQFTLRFIMPDHDVSFRLTGNHWDGSTWVQDDISEVFVVSAQVAGPHFSWIQEQIYS